MKLTLERIWDTLRKILFYNSDNIHSWSYPVLLVLQKGLKFVSNANQKQAKALNNITHFLTNVLFYLYLSDFNCKSFAPSIFKNLITKKKRKKI